MSIRMNMKRAVAICLLVVMAISTPAAFAARLFTDVPEDYWAMPFIIKVVENDIMPGYSDATYKPSKAVSKLEVITSIYNTICASGKFDKLQGDVLSMKFGATIDSAGIPKTLAPYGETTWAAVGYALENEILHPDELKGFVIEGELAEATKLEASIFLGKGMNIFLNENLQRIISFDYKDAFSITSAAAPYVDLLIQNDVISSKGDDKGNFNPKQVVTREVLATLLSGAYGVLSGEIVPVESDDDSEIITVPKGDTKTYEAIVSSVHEDIEIIEVRDGGGKLHVYDGSSASIVRDGNDLELEDVNKGMDVTVHEVDGELSKLVINKQFDKTEGKYDAKSDELTDADGTYCVITIVTDNGKKYFKAYDSAVIVKDGEPVELDDLEFGDRLHMNVEGFMVREVEAYSPSSVVSGVLNRTTDFKKGSSISIQLDKGSYIDQTLESDIEVQGAADGIRKGDIIKVTLQYGKVVKVESTGMSSELSGTITSILISETPEVTVLTSDGVSKTAQLKEDMEYILLDGDDEGDVYDLRLDQSITLKMDGMGVKTLIMNKIVEKVKFKAEITEIYQTANLLKVKDDAGQVWTVSFSEDATFNILDYEVGDSVFVIGFELSDDLFEAEHVIGM